MNIKKFDKECFNVEKTPLVVSIDNEQINDKYTKGETRLVTEQTRYPLPTLMDLFNKSNAYELQPDFQRRKGRGCPICRRKKL